MAARGTQFSRTMEYFHSVTLDEASAALGAAQEIVSGRRRILDLGKTTQVQGSKRRARRSRVADSIDNTSADAAYNANVASAD